MRDRDIWLDRITKAHGDRYEYPDLDGKLTGL